MTLVCRVYEGVNRDQRLQQLGLTASIFIAAVEAGDAESRQCTDNDPPMARGLVRYFRTVRVLREGAAVFGWTGDNPRNLARTVSPARDHAIVPALGDGNTGRSTTSPSTKYDKGSTIIDAVDVNEQLALFDLPSPDDDTASMNTWVLLYHIDENEIRYELSLPVGSQRGYISRWRERILFAPLPREAVAGFGGDDEGGPEIDILVARR